MWKYCGFLLCGASLAFAAPQNSPATPSASAANDSSNALMTSFLNVCGGQPTASVSCGAHDSEEHLKTIEVRVIYWLSTPLPFYEKTVQYDVVQYESTVSTTATRTITNNATGLDMQSYTSLIPSAQVSPSGPYDISEVDAVYGTLETIGTHVLTYPTPYALILSRIHVHQMGMCDDGTEFTTSAWFSQPAPIPLPTTLPYLNMDSSVNFTIPGFNEAFHNLYPALDYCSFSAFSGQPSPKVVVETAVTTNIRTVSALQADATPTSASSSMSGGGGGSNAAALSSAAGQLGSLASYIICGLGASCSSSSGSSPSSAPASVKAGATDSHGRAYFMATPTASTAPTVATLGGQGSEAAVPLYTQSGGAVVVPQWRTLTPGAAAATVGDAVMSVGTDGVVVVDGNTVAKGAVQAAQTGDGGGGSTGRSTSSGSSGGGGSQGTTPSEQRSLAAMVVGERGRLWVLGSCLVASTSFVLAFL
ncbi:hypothetical protein DBV05_g5014 [Lasiodiplodia theobromae]|uniref:Uncharacterized protein n=1 Tax=Lasiodiplodia theobromae TaxID=45133 RepID=A0A5N5DHA0_9PEZI|nr:hypothetical protein DBV05_g5014 [Lasiodiplodia theobromae]